MKDKIKKTTLTTLSGAIVVSTMPLNVFADALNEELGSGIVTQETANLIAPDTEENQPLEIETEDVIEAEGTKETEVENIPVESEEIELEVEEPLELDILDSEGDVHEEIEEPIESEEAVLEEVAVNEEVNNELQQNGSSESERSVDKTQTVIDIPDTNLEDAIRQELNKPTGDITQADMESLMVLDAVAFGIKDLTGLEYAVNLCGLYLPYNQIDDISILSGLTKLEDLALDGNQISDISALSGMTNLVNLELSNNQISNISALSGMTNLEWLGLSDNQINDISALSGLTNLEGLGLSDNQINDISALSGMTNLVDLDLSNNQISNISALSGMTNLESLMLNDNKISDISSLAGMVNLDYLELEYNEISDISALSGMVNLYRLDLSCNEVSDISALKGLTKMDTLIMSDNQITNISALSGMNLRYLNLGYNQINDISALSGMTNLRYLFLFNNEISDISVLNGMNNLRELDLEGNKISDISVINAMTNLDRLFIGGNEVSDEDLVDVLSRLSKLTHLSISFNEEPDLSSFKKLNYLYILNSTISDFSSLQLNDTVSELYLNDCEVDNWDSIKALTSLGLLWINGVEIPDYKIFEELPNLWGVYLIDNSILDLSQFDAIQDIVWVVDQHAKLDAELVDSKIENPFIDLDGSYITTIDLPNGVTLSDDGAYLIFDNPLVGDSYELTAKSYQTDQYNHYGKPVELKATFTITAYKKTGGELTVEENILSNFDKELQIEIKDAAYEIEKIILPDGTEVQGNTATYVVKESGDYTIKYVDVKGNEFTQTITVKVDKPVIDKPSTGDSAVDKPTTSTNQAPIITASNVSIPVGYNLDLMSLATATDKEDGELVVKLTSSNLDNTKPGIYQVTYEATDSKGLSTTKTIHIVVRDLSEDENPDTKDIVIAPNEELDIESIVNEIAKDKGLTDVEILENNVNTSKPGDYSVVFEGTNAQKEQEIHSIKVTVATGVSSDKEDDSSSTNKPSGESVETGLTSGATITLGGLFTLAGIPFLKRKRK